MSYEDNPKQEECIELSTLYEYSNEFNPFVSGIIVTSNPIREAACSLRTIGEPAFQNLLEILKNKNNDKRIRRSAAWVFMETFQPSTKDLFIKMLSDKKED